MNQKILNILTIILTVVLWGLQMLPNKTTNEFLQWIKDNLYYIAGVAALIVVALHLIDLYRGRERHIKEWLITFLKHILLKTEDIHPPKTGISVHFSGSLV